MTADAKKIVDAVLETTGQALLQGDFEPYARHFLLPARFETFDGHHSVTTSAELAAMFAAIRDHYAQIGLKDLVRSCVSAEMQPDGSIKATHETRMICHGNVLHRAAYPVMGAYIHKDGVWQINACQHAVSGTSPYGRALMGQAAA